MRSPLLDLPGAVAANGVDAEVAQAAADQVLTEPAVAAGEVEDAGEVGLPGGERGVEGGAHTLLVRVAVGGAELGVVVGDAVALVEVADGFVRHGVRRTRPYRVHRLRLRHTAFWPLRHEEE